MREKLDQVAENEDVDRRWAGVVGFEQPEAALQSVEDELMAVDALHTLVSGAIWRAEQLDELGLDSAFGMGARFPSLKRKWQSHCQ